MRKLFWQMNVTLDGFMEGPDQDLTHTAQVVDPELDRYAAEMLASIDGMLLGRVTYEMFAQYWPTATDPEAERMNALPKFVFSETLEGVAWQNAELVEGDAVEAVRRLKEEPGADLALFGSAGLAATFLRHGLIDEIRMFVNPVVIGEGTPMFKDVKQVLPLKLVRSHAWRSGIVALYYQPDGEPSG